MEVKKKINIPMILLLLYMFIFILFFIVLAITSKDDLAENMEVDRIRRDIFRLLNKDTEVYVEGVKLEGKEREKVLRIFNGEDLKVNYQGKEKSMIVHIYDESEEVLKKYVKK